MSHHTEQARRGDGRATGRKRRISALTAVALAVSVISVVSVIAAVAPLSGVADNGVYGDSDTYEEWYCVGAVLNRGDWCFRSDRHSDDHNWAVTGACCGADMCTALHTWDTHQDVTAHVCESCPTNYRCAQNNFSPNYNTLLRPGIANAPNAFYASQPMDGLDQF